MNLLKSLLVMTIAVAAVSGCTNVRPLVEYQHASHATQHGKGIANDAKRSLDTFSVGIVWRPYKSRLRVELLEGITMYESGITNKHEEVFHGRITLELGRDWQD
jgi:hypothetical protein